VHQGTPRIDARGEKRSLAVANSGLNSLGCNSDLDNSLADQVGLSIDIQHSAATERDYSILTEGFGDNVPFNLSKRGLTLLAKNLADKTVLFDNSLIGVDKRHGEYSSHTLSEPGLPCTGGSDDDQNRC